MEKSKNTACLNDLWKEMTAAKYPFLELIGMMLAVIVICIQNCIFSVKQSFLRTYAELSVAEDENEQSCANERTLNNQKCLLNDEISSRSDEVSAGRRHDESNCTFAAINLLSRIAMKLRSLVTKSNTNRLIRAW